MYCYLCEEYIGVLSTGRYCETCRKIKNIQRVYGKKEVLEILVDICLRDEMKRENKVKHAINNNCYSPACKNRPLTRSQSMENTKKE